MSSRRFPRIGPTTVVAYLALFIALGGSGYAATRIASAASSGGVKVRCSASRSGKRVSCKVVKGSGIGPRGLQGPPGTNAASGPITYNSPPAFSFVTQTPGTSPNSATSVGYGTLHNDLLGGYQYQPLTLYTDPDQTIPVSAPGEPISQTPVSGPTGFDGSTAKFYSAGFCYGGQLSATVSTEQVTHIALVEYVESNGSVPADTSQPPAYTTDTIWSAPITNAVPATTNGAGGCLTVGPSSPVAVQPGGQFALWITATYTAPQGNASGAVLTFGRITTTFGS